MEVKRTVPDGMEDVRRHYDVGDERDQPRTLQ